MHLNRAITVWRIEQAPRSDLDFYPCRPLQMGKVFSTPSARLRYALTLQLLWAADKHMTKSFYLLPWLYFMLIVDQALFKKLICTNDVWLLFLAAHFLTNAFAETIATAYGNTHSK